MIYIQYMYIYIWYIENLNVEVTSLKNPYKKMVVEWPRPQVLDARDPGACRSQALEREA